MISDLALIAGTSAWGGVVVTTIAQWRQRRKFRREAKSTREALELGRSECAAQFEEFRNTHRELEASLASTRDVLRNGRLNGSARAAALQLLRTGMCPDSAASSLGIAKRELRMLARVLVLLAEPPALRGK